MQKYFCYNRHDPYFDRVPVMIWLLFDAPFLSQRVGVREKAVGIAGKNGKKNLFCLFFWLLCPNLGLKMRQIGIWWAWLWHKSWPKSINILFKPHWILHKEESRRGKKSFQKSGWGEFFPGAFWGGPERKKSLATGKIWLDRHEMRSR